MAASGPEGGAAESAGVEAGRDVSCGVGAAYLLLLRLGRPVPLERVEAAAPVPPGRPMSMAELKVLFERLGLRAEGYRMPLGRVDRPVIAYYPGRHQGAGHFLVVEPVGPADTGGADSGGQGGAAAAAEPRPMKGRAGVRPRHFLVLDPARSPLRLPAERLQRLWDGRVLVVLDPDGPKRASLRWARAIALAGLTAGGLILAAVLSCRLYRAARTVTRG